MQHPVHQLQPQLPPLAARVGLAALVALVLAGVVATATSASHTAVHHASAQMQDARRYVKLPPVEIVGRRDVAIEQGDAPEGRSAAATDSTPACVQPT